MLREPDKKYVFGICRLPFGDFPPHPLSEPAPFYLRAQGVTALCAASVQGTAAVLQADRHGVAGMTATPSRRSISFSAQLVVTGCCSCGGGNVAGRARLLRVFPFGPRWRARRDSSVTRSMASFSSAHVGATSAITTRRNAMVHASLHSLCDASGARSRLEPHTKQWLQPDVVCCPRSAIACISPQS